MTSSRQQQIVGQLTSRGFCTVDELAKVVDISSVTMRRDLAALEADGVVVRVHGGAKLADSVALGIPYAWRRHQNEEQKRRVAEYAATLVKPGQTVFIDAGTTCALLSEALPETTRLRVVTHSVENALVLRQRQSIELICAGGRYERELGSSVGEITEQTLALFHADISFLAAAHINVDQGLVNNHLGERAIKRIIHNQCDTCYLLADSSKFGVHGVQSTLSFDEFRGAIVTDSGLGLDQQALFAGRGIRITLV